MMLKKTKIVASISDLRCDVDFIRDLFNAGMNVVRMNTAHANREGFETLIRNVREVSNRIGILMDTKGPEVRTTACAEGPIDYKTGETVRIIGAPEQATTRACICVTYPYFVNDLSVGARVLIDDGDLELKVVEKARGRKAAMQRLVQMYRDALDFGDAEPLVIVDHAGCPEEAEALAEQLRAVSPAGTQVLVTGLSPIIGAHTGPGPLTVCHFGTGRMG